MPLTGLDWRLFNYQQLEFHGKIDFLKAGIVFSDAITTVSPTYAREIQTPYYGCGLEGALAERRDRLTGIVNGVDYTVWNPATDPHLAANYDAVSVMQGKPICKAALQRRFGLPEKPKVPLLGIVSRLVEQKGIHLVGKTADTWLTRISEVSAPQPSLSPGRGAGTRGTSEVLSGRADEGTQLVILGEGDPMYHRML